MMALLPLIARRGAGGAYLAGYAWRPDFSGKVATAKIF